MAAVPVQGRTAPLAVLRVDAIVTHAKEPDFARLHRPISEGRPPDVAGRVESSFGANVVVAPDTVSGQTRGRNGRPPHSPGSGVRFGKLVGPGATVTAPEEAGFCRLADQDWRTGLLIHHLA